MQATPDVAEPERDPTDPGPGASHDGVDVPARWQGGRLEGTERALTADFHDQAAHGDAAILELDTNWAALEGLDEADPPGPIGFDLSSLPGTGGGGARQTETLSGVIKVLSKTGTGVILEELPDEWLNVSKFSKGVDLGGLGVGDVVAVDVEVGGNGKRYIQRIRALDQGADRG